MEKIISDNRLEWTNVMLQREPNKKDAPSSYFVIYTPTLVLFNKEGKILRRFIGVNELERNTKTIQAMSKRAVKSSCYL